MFDRVISFRGGTRTLLWFGGALTFWILAFTLVDSAASDVPAWLELLKEVAKFGALLGITWYVLRVEEVSLADLGASRRYLAPALLTFGGVWVAVNVVGVAVAAATGNEWAVEFIWRIPDPVSEQFGTLPASWVAFVLLQFVVVGVVEEFVVRGYFQTKVVAMVGDDTRLRVALGVLTASVLFGLLHTPGALVARGSVEAVVGSAALPAITGIFFGAFYHWTRNVYFVAALHGLGNSWPIVVEWQNWSGNALVAFFAGVGVVYVGAVFAYRYWMQGTDLTPLVSREDTGSSAVAN